jgi:hypothetical protein
MNELTDIATISRSAENTATVHIRDRYEQLEPLSLTIPEKRFLFGRKRLKRKQKLIVCKGRLNPMLLNKEG